MGFIFAAITFSYGQRSKCADLPELLPKNRQWMIKETDRKKADMGKANMRKSDIEKADRKSEYEKERYRKS